jgi:hypothetical protein
MIFQNFKIFENNYWELKGLIVYPIDAFYYSMYTSLVPATFDNIILKVAPHPCTCSFVIFIQAMYTLI